MMLHQYLTHSELCREVIVSFKKVTKGICKNQKIVTRLEGINLGSLEVFFMSLKCRLLRD